MGIGILWADWDRAAGANPNDIMLTKIARELKIARFEERKHIGFHHFQLSLPHYKTYLVWNLEEVDLDVKLIAMLKWHGLEAPTPFLFFTIWGL